MGLEASLYTIPATSTCLLYVAKVDTTGLISYSKELSSPARELTRAFLAYHFARPPRGMKRLRVHIFGRAADQYLFPLSADNKGKKVLDDRRLCAWWKSVLSESAPASAERYYLFPGFTELEATRIAPQDTPAWTYGHPYSATSSPLYTTMHVTPLSEASPSPSASSDLVLTVGDLIPNFSDDPKGRYTRSLAQSRAENVGDVGDYDDVVRKAEKASNAALAKLQHDRLERDLSSERARLANVQLDQWWENMAFRQECSGGRICAFFVVVQDEPVDIVPPESRIDPLAGSVAHNVYTTLWQKMHDIDYSSREEAVAKIHDWQAAVSKACDSDTSAICRSITIDRARPDKSEDLKRSAPVAAVTKLMPRKKLKPAAA
ncbi:uncharacterized protein L969DRAFT_86881 [Mixia osmundae IAM 14324]|nr:uncharacterized protein L969DRAFT_86881 [Mixia osmundae IAM 14324]KEI40245.1 hypothetical protein L969DRAFT_86881 [Mixia osmundae IAM 14324]